MPARVIPYWLVVSGSNPRRLYFAGIQNVFTKAVGAFLRWALPKSQIVCKHWKSTTGWQRWEYWSRWTESFTLLRRGNSCAAAREVRAMSKLLLAPPRSIAHSRWSMVRGGQVKIWISLQAESLAFARLLALVCAGSCSSPQRRRVSSCTLKNP